MHRNVRPLSEPTVLIAGAGPTGLALACDLRLRGVDALVVDRLERPASTTRALGLQPRGRQILDRLGVLGDLPQRAPRQTLFDIYAEGRLAARIDIASLQGQDDEGPLRVPQTAIEERLRGRLHELGGQILWGYELCEASTHATGVAVVLRSRNDERVMRCAWLIGCDGAHSVCRRLIGAEFAGTAYPQTFLLGDVHLTRPRQGGAAIYLRHGQLLSMASLPDGRWRMGVQLPPGDPLAKRETTALTTDRIASSIAAREALTRLQALYAAISGDRTMLLCDPTWLSVFRIHRRIASRFRRGRVLIAGDAAHLTSPLGGQGMNSGLSDAFNLGWKLALVIQGRTDDRLLDTYEAERRPAIAATDRATAAWTNVLLADGFPSRIFRRWVALPAMRLGPVHAWVLTGRRALQSSYRGGPLAPQARKGWFDRLTHRGPQPGDCAPDAICRWACDDVSTRIGREIGPNWGMIIFAAASAATRACTEMAREYLGEDLRIIYATASADVTVCGKQCLLCDHAGALVRAYRPGSDSVLLVRPDGHVAWRSTLTELAGLRYWLAEVLRLRRFEPASIRKSIDATHVVSLANLGSAPRSVGR